ncbi:hypothetical protein DPMN_145845 [Dreissena polymorpha]|uniref:Deleted in malignant brain tumors 1 protein-like n=1 Tax=Dreissena polymorpha TaxID=45954 RepID=A0A9D4IXX2_DREPO|nr:hypothetical protein DPMN_145845 [Dreissena polymorpha]
MCRMNTRVHTETCGNHNQAGVECNPTNISLSGVRLVDGPGPWNVRLEVRSNGGWGSVCYDSWKPANANVVCETLRYSLVNASVMSYPISRGLTSMFAGSLMCNDTVRNLGQCLMDYDIFNCSKTRAHAVGVDCSGGLSVSLGNPGNFSGQVFIHTGNGDKWSVCASALNTSSAAVLCSTAGFQQTRPNISTVMSQVPVLFSDIACDGWESHVLQCSTSNGSTGCYDKAAVDCFNGCVQFFGGTSGTFTSPRYSGYPPNTDCLYVITNAAGQPTKLAFTDLDLAGDGDVVKLCK